MVIFEDEWPANLYRQQLQVLGQAPQVEVRGMQTRELLDVATVLTHPWRRFALVPGRELNPFLAMSEGLHLLGGRDDVASLLPYNRRIVEYSDDGQRLYGAYGARLQKQVEPLIDHLKYNPTSRRGVMTIWRQGDLNRVTKDPPCNDMLMFKFRQGRLHMTVVNRSNDLHWGLWAVNVPEFSMLLEYLAGRLGVAMGSQTHTSNSLHIYTDGPSETEQRAAAITAAMLRRAEEPIPVYRHGLMFPSYDEIPEVDVMQSVVDDVFRGRLSGKWSRTKWWRFALEYLRLYREKGRRYNDNDLQRLSWANHYPDWITAAKEFAKWNFSNSGISLGSSFS